MEILKWKKPEGFYNLGGKHPKWNGKHCINLPCTNFMILNIDRNSKRDLLRKISFILSAQQGTSSLYNQFRSEIENLRTWKIQIAFDFPLKASSKRKSFLRMSSLSFSLSFFVLSTSKYQILSSFGGKTPKKQETNQKTKSDLKLRFWRFLVNINLTWSGKGEFLSRSFDNQVKYTINKPFVGLKCKYYTKMAAY